MLNISNSCQVCHRESEQELKAQVEQIQDRTFELKGKTEAALLDTMDATALAVCDPHRISQHKVFAGLAQRGKTSTSWFFGFKLHVLVDDLGEDERPAIAIH